MNTLIALLTIGIAVGLLYAARSIDGRDRRRV
jgi:hypothetical protein